MMLKWAKELDRILRGEATNLPALREGRIDVPVGGLALIIMLLGFVTGSCVGSFSVFRPGGPFFMQLLASTLKVLRPFIGDPQRPVQFFRDEAWGNAYVVVAELIWKLLTR